MLDTFKEIAALAASGGTTGLVGLFLGLASKGVDAIQFKIQKNHEYRMMQLEGEIMTKEHEYAVKEQEQVTEMVIENAKEDTLQSALMNQSDISKAIAGTRGGNVVNVMASGIRVLGGYIALFYVVGLAIYAGMVWLPSMPVPAQEFLLSELIRSSVENATIVSNMMLGFWFGQRMTSPFKKK